MAKTAAPSDKIAKLTKKKSQQELKVDAPPRVKKSKEGPAPAPVESSSSKPKKEKDADKAVEGSASMVEEKPTKVASKKDKKKRESAVVVEDAAPAQEEKGDEATGKKRKRKSLASAEESLEAAENPKKKRESVVKAVLAKPQKEEAQQSAEPGEKKKKRKAAAVEEKRDVSQEKTKKKRKDAAAETKEVASDASPAKAASADPKPTQKKANAARATKEPPSPAPALANKEAKKSKAKTAAPAPKPAPEPEESDEEPAEAQPTDEQEFYGFSSDDDSSDEEEVADDISGIDMSKLPTIAKDDAVVKKKLEKAKRKPTGDRGVIFLGRLPHGFYEDQMRAYFSQFGSVTRLRLSRNKMTGKSKHYAFIEFDSSSVAQIVAETMDNYLLTGHILTCKVIPKDQVHPELWVGANRKWRPVPRDRLARVAHNKPRTEEETAKAEARLLKRQEQRKRKLEEAGIKYDFEAVAYKKRPKPTEA
ncbi:hypothetical protein C8Q74DRAFT_647087 [Fomes fomentarius]|nr:hypothetical protein C8Q74DRAFT_647087 [Fomes fomentarius]